MDSGTFKKVINYLGLKPTKDGFPTSINTKCEKYFSKYPKVGSSGLNFFAHKLDQENVKNCDLIKCDQI